MRGSEDGTASTVAHVVGEGELSGARGGSRPSGGDPAALQVRELGDGSSVQLGACEEQLGAGKFVPLLDAVAAVPRSNADIGDFDDTEFHGWHAPREGASSRAAERQ